MFDESAGSRFILIVKLFDYCVDGVIIIILEFVGCFLVECPVC